MTADREVGSAPPGHRNVRRYRGHELGLRPYPVGTITSEPPEGHVMAATATAWLCDLAIDRWGPAWPASGSIDLRFRSHLAAGIDVELVSEHDAEGIDLCIRTDLPDATYVTGRATGAGMAPIAMPAGKGPDVAVTPEPAALNGLVLRPVRFVFDADRDLAATDHLPNGGGFWRRRGWANPGWLATAANAAARTSIELAPAVWAYAGVRLDLHAPVVDGTELVIGGRIAELFDTARHRFAVCELAVVAPVGAVASMRTTFVYDRVA